MEKTDAFYSIIIPSFNRKEEIGELIESFHNLDFPSDKFELIIVDDGSSDGTDEFVKNYSDTVPFRFKFFRQENKGPGFARNLGVTYATGDFIIFVDSDCTVDPQWLKNIDNALKWQKADAFGGPDSFREDFSPLLKAINYSMTSFMTTGGLRGRKGKKFAKYYPRSFNMGLSKKLFLKIGGFCSLRHGQDIEFSNRILKSGANVIYISTAIVYHKRRTSLKKFFRQVFNWGTARINLYKIDKSMLEVLHAVPAIVLIFMVCLFLGSLFSRVVWYITCLFLFMGILALLLSAIHAVYRYKSIKVFFFVPLIMPIQVTGYGLGFIWAYIYAVLLGRSEIVGFKKHYYK